MPNNTIWSFNKGEWAEAYVFLKLLGNGRIYGADENGHRLDDVYMDIAAILKTDNGNQLTFERVSDYFGADKCAVDASCNGSSFKIICCKELSEKAQFLYEAIRADSVTKGAFTVSGIQEYLEDLRLTSPKASLSTEEKKEYGNKSDIIVKAISSIEGNAMSTLGYSIKSNLGSPPTLFNISNTSGLIYEVKNCNDNYMHRFNSIKDTRKAFSYLRDNQLALLLVGDRNENYANNLSFVDSRMIEMVDFLFKARSGYLENTDARSIKELTEYMIECNPLEVMRPNDWYKAKIKDLLFACFSGLTASKAWDGIKRVSGGYIDVLDNGEIVFYRALSDNVFSSFLYNNTVIEAPSRGSNQKRALIQAEAVLEDNPSLLSNIQNIKRDLKGDYGYIFKESGKYYTAMNYSIRFT